VVLWRHLRPSAQRFSSPRRFLPVGAGASFLSALVGSVGPIMAPFFLSYGLVKGAYIGTEALSTVVMHVTKLIVYRQASVLSGRSALVGLSFGPLMIAGSYIGKRIVDKLPERAFIAMIELVLLVAGGMFLLQSF
jgi:uncharacterized membrane protein YfcA